MKSKILLAVFMLIYISASAQYVSVTNSWSTDNKTLSITIKNTSSKPMMISNGLFEESASSHLDFIFLNSSNVELGRNTFVYQKASDKVRSYVVIPANSSITCESYNLYGAALGCVSSAKFKEIKKIQVIERIKYHIPALNFNTVYTNTTTVNVNW
ncbi:hypothetical protein FACS189434_07540 [Bacteroidia bacterium]|nr:hypothetical protein FACS189434_07540 [Bacteroidia bacterium]